MFRRVFFDLFDGFWYAVLVVRANAAWRWLRRRVRRLPQTHGDPSLAAELAPFATRRSGRVAVAVIDQHSQTATRFAFVGDGADTCYEIGSLTKALTGMLLADAIHRGELTEDTTVGAVLPDLTPAPLGSLTVKELCTHTSGLPALPKSPATSARLFLLAAFGLDPYRHTSPQRVLRLAARQPLRGRGRYRYSNLGAAVLGQVLAAAAAGADYPTLLHDRILSPLGMTHTAISTSGHHARHGHSARGGRRQPWILDGYSPAGGLISTIEDLARLATALLDGTAPGQASLRQVVNVDTATPSRAAGMFWVIESAAPGTDRTMMWHNGETGGYSAFMVLYPHDRQAVIVLANAARAPEQQHLAFALTSIYQRSTTRQLHHPGDTMTEHVELRDDSRVLVLHCFTNEDL